MTRALTNRGNHADPRVFCRAFALVLAFAPALLVGCGGKKHVTHLGDASLPGEAGVAMDSGASRRDGSVARVDAATHMKDASTSAKDAAADASLTTPQLIARGKYLVEHVAACNHCHTPRKSNGSFDPDRPLSGVECLIDSDPDPTLGCLNSRNLTNDPTGLKNRTDQEIKDMFMKGVRPDGQALHPYMPYWVFGNMSGQDADAIVSYLRTLPAVEHMVPPSQAPFLPPDMPAPLFPEAMIPMPAAGYAEFDSAMRGRYLAGDIGVCLECHTPRDSMQRPIVAKAFQGGNQFTRFELGLPSTYPDIIYSANITPDPTGIKGWTAQDVIAALKLGQDQDQNGAPICPPMPSGPMGSFGGINDDDANDIANYLLAIPPGANAIPVDCIAMPMKPPPPPPPPPEDAGTEDAGH